MMFSLTQVEPERQKVRASTPSSRRQPTSGEPAPDTRAPPPPQIMVKGTIVKDDENWSKYKLKEKMMLCAAPRPLPAPAAPHAPCTDYNGSSGSEAGAETDAAPALAQDDDGNAVGQGGPGARGGHGLLRGPGGRWRG